MKKLEKGQQLQKEDLVNLEELGAIINSFEMPVEGEYQDYLFTVDENYEVTIENKLQGNKPTITYTLNTQDPGVKTVTIQLSATVKDAKITKITLPDKTVSSGGDPVSYTVNQSGIYEFKVEASNGRRSYCKVAIKNIAVQKPITSTKDAWPILTPDGVNSAIETQISYENNPYLEHYYSLDGGRTWTPYTNVLQLNPGTVLAKSVFKGNQNEILAQTSSSVNLAKDAVGTEAFDGSTTDPFYRVSTSRFIKLDPRCQGKFLTLYCKTLHYWPSQKEVGSVTFYNESKTSLSNTKLTNLSAGSMQNLCARSLLIPTDASYVMFDIEGTDDRAALCLYEVWCSDLDLTGTTY